MKYPGIIVVPPAPKTDPTEVCLCPKCHAELVLDGSYLVCPNQCDPTYKVLDKTSKKYTSGMSQAEAIRDRFLDPYAPHIDSEYMIVTPYRKKPKTWVYQVNSRRQGSVLGYIKWFARWRQYAFQPETDTTFSKGCLNDISTFIKMLMDERASIKNGGNRMEEG